MADKIRWILDKELPNMISLEKRGYFDQDRIKSILKKREINEYSMMKSKSNKLDYLKSIEFEMNLENERKNKSIELNIKNLTNRDFSIIKRILFIFNRLIKKFKYNIKVWKEFLKFCIQIESKKHFYKIINQAIKYNSTHLDLWLIAVYYEVELNNNFIKARNIFFEGIDRNQGNFQFLIHYFKFECEHYLFYKNRENALLNNDDKIDEEDNEFLKFSDSSENEDKDNDESSENEGSLAEIGEEDWNNDFEICLKAMENIFENIDIKNIDWNYFNNIINNIELGSEELVLLKNVLKKYLLNNKRLLIDLNIVEVKDKYKFMVDIDNYLKNKINIDINNYIKDNKIYIKQLKLRDFIDYDINIKNFTNNKIIFDYFYKNEDFKKHIEENKFEIDFLEINIDILKNKKDILNYMELFLKKLNLSIKFNFWEKKKIYIILINKFLNWKLSDLNINIIIERLVKYFKNKSEIFYVLSELVYNYHINNKDININFESIIYNKNKIFDKIIDISLENNSIKDTNKVYENNKKSISYYTHMIKRNINTNITEAQRIYQNSLENLSQEDKIKINEIYLDLIN